MFSRLINSIKDFLYVPSVKEQFEEIIAKEEAAPVEAAPVEAAPVVVDSLPVHGNHSAEEEKTKKSTNPKTEGPKKPRAPRKKKSASE